MISGKISQVRNWRYTMSIFEDREPKKQDESDLASMNNKGVVINRGTLRLSIGGIYKKQDSDEEYQLIEFVDTNQAFFKNLKTLKVQVLSIHQFENVHDADHAVMRLDIDAISDKEWERAQAKHAAIEPILRHDDDYDGYAGIERRAQECGVSTRTLQRWLSSYLKTNSIASLIDKKRGWQEGRRRIDAVQELIIDEVIQDYYLTIQRPTIQAAIQEVFKRCHLSGVKKPSKNAIRYQIGKIDEKEYLKARGYRSRAKNKFTPKVGSFPNVNAPLSVIQIDHTPADIILVDDKHRKPIGRPYITVAIDIYSRMITGYYISLDAPSVTSVGMCLTRSILPKEELLLSHGIQDVTWDVFGIPKKIHVDNGSDFRAESLKRSCSLYGIDIEFRPLARPEYGGHIERIIGNLMHEVHKLPGTTFSNIRQKDGYDSEKHASLTLGEFETWFLTYITKIYHQKPHSALGCSPAQQWRIGIFGDDVHEGIGIPSVPTSPQTLVLDFMPSVERTIQHTGVTIDGLQYYDTILNSYINTTDNKTDKKRKFIFRQDPRDISMVWFFDPNIKQYFKIPCANQAFPPMSIWEYNQLKKQVKQRSGTVNESLIYQAWEEMRTMIDAAQSTTKTARRQAQRRKTHIQSQKIHESARSQEDDVTTKAAELTVMDDALQGLKTTTLTSSVQHDDDSTYFEDIE